ncbi:MAG: hypothetical protein ABI165_20070 [Bryobacteraceae bacterium]
MFQNLFLRTLEIFGDSFERDGNGAAGEIGARLPVRIRIQEDGIRKRKLERVAIAAGFLEFIGGRGGDAGQCIFHTGREMGDVIVG